MYSSAAARRHIFFLFLLLSAAAAAAAIDRDAAALLALKSAWSDPDNFLSSWSSSSDSPCTSSWLGVSCDLLNTTVLSLSLPNLRLLGSLSPSISNLSSLISLSLPRTSLSGPLPDRFPPSLSFLDLSHNRFSGPFPSSAISNLSSLLYLDLEFNDLDGPLPSSSSSFPPSLSTLRLRSNRFHGSLPLDPPPPLLQTLLLDNNLLSGPIPSKIALASRLRFFSASNNALSGDLPPNITRLSRLSSLYLASNSLSGPIPPDIGTSLPRLVRLDLSYNSLFGTIPPSLGDLRLLRTLNLSTNRLYGSVPASLGNLSSLHFLDLSRNNLSGELPANGVLSNFSVASFQGNPGLCGVLLSKNCSPPFPSPPNILGGGGGGGGVVGNNSSNSTSSTSTATDNTSRRSSSSSTGKIVAGSVAGAVALGLIVSLALFWLRRWRAGASSSSASRIQNGVSPDDPLDPSAPQTHNPKLVMFIRAFRYTYEEVVSHAGYCDTAHMVSKGRFATVFRSDLPNGTQLAVKLFRNAVAPPYFEREMVGLEAAAAQFPSLLPIRGFYASPQECVVLYEFMPRGTLYDFLHRRPEDEAAALMDWHGRLAVATGVAQAILHLHRGSSIKVLHKDIKSSNVLLDEELQPKVADYGLIGLVSAPVVETAGYAAPELKGGSSAGKYTEKTDVYSYGVVLLELLTGKKPVSWVGNRELSLVTWVVRLWREGRGGEVVSGKLVVGSGAWGEQAERALSLAVQCVAEQAAQRPSMAEVVGVLDGLAAAAAAASATASPMLSPGLRPERPLLPVPSSTISSSS